MPGVFQSDAILPLQYFAPLRRQAPSHMGEYRLLVAVLEDAIRCFQHGAVAPGKRSRRLFAETHEWIMGEGTASRADRDMPSLSFEYICDVLGIDPRWLRQGLQRWLRSASDQGRRGIFNAQATAPK